MAEYFRAEKHTYTLAISASVNGLHLGMTTSCKNNTLYESAMVEMITVLLGLDRQLVWRRYLL